MKFKIQRSWLIFGVAAALGIGAGLLAMQYLNQRVAEIESHGKKQLRKVIVAKLDLQKGAVLSPETVAVRDVPTEWSHSGAITPEQFDRAANAALAYPAVKGEPLMWSQLQGQRAPSFSSRLAEGRRAVTVPVDEISSLSGMVDPGDRIDIVVTVRQEKKNITFALLQSVVVLATGTRVTPKSEEEGGKPKTFNTVTLDTTPEDAKRIIAAREVGKITALLRSPGDLGEVSRQKSEAFALLGFSEEAQKLKESGVPVIYGGSGHKLKDIPQLNLGAPAPQRFGAEAIADVQQLLDLQRNTSKQ